MLVAERREFSPEEGRRLCPKEAHCKLKGGIFANVLNGKTFFPFNERGLCG